jgi:hypothetical protein
MDFEFIDENDVVPSRRAKKKKTESLYDTAFEDRTYWGYVTGPGGEKVVDSGTQLAMSTMRLRIDQTLRKGVVIEVDDAYPARRLNNEFITELIQYQNDSIKYLIAEGVLLAHLDNKGKWIIDKVLENN